MSGINDGGGDGGGDGGRTRREVLGAVLGTAAVAATAGIASVGSTASVGGSGGVVGSPSPHGFHTGHPDVSFLELPQPVQVFEWWDSDLGLIVPREGGGPSLHLGVRRVHVSMLPSVAPDEMRVQVPSGGGHVFSGVLSPSPLSFMEARMRLHELHAASGDRGGDLLWVTSSSGSFHGSGQRIGHFMAWVPFGVGENSTAGIAGRMSLPGLPHRTLVGDRLMQDEKSAITGQPVVGVLLLGRLSGITGMTWFHAASWDHYEARDESRGLDVYLMQEGRASSWELSVWAQGRRHERAGTAGCIARLVGPDPYRLVRAPWDSEGQPPPPAV